MTANQISFYKAKNEKQHYDRMDRETKRHNVKTEALNQSDLNIKDWFNKASIAKDYANIDMLTYHYGQADEAALRNAEANVVNASTKKELTQLDLAKEYGVVTVGPAGDYYLTAESYNNGPISYQIKQEELEQAKADTSTKMFGNITQGLGALGRIVGPITQAIIKVMN